MAVASLHFGLNSEVDKQGSREPFRKAGSCPSPIVLTDIQTLSIFLSKKRPDYCLYELKWNVSILRCKIETFCKSITSRLPIQFLFKFHKVASQYVRYPKLRDND